MSAAPDESLTDALDAAERELDADRIRWTGTAGLLAAVAVGMSFLLPWRISNPGTAMLSRAGYADHRTLLIWWGLGLAATIAGLCLRGRPRMLASVVVAVAGAVLWYLAIRVAGAEVGTDGGSLFSRRELTTGPGPALAAVGATVMLAAGIVPIVALLTRSRTEFSDYQRSDAVRRLRATRTDRPVDTPRLD